MSGEPRGRGRARGRARPSVAAAPQAAQPQVQPAPRAGPSGAPAGRSGALPIGRFGARTQPSVKKITEKIGSVKIFQSEGNGNGNGNGRDSKPMGRGQVRGGKFLDASCIYTRPEPVSKHKKGTSGQAVKIQTNYFQLISSNKWTIYKHHVDFNPCDERTFIRKKLFRDVSSRFVGHIFDGSTLFSIAPLCQPNSPLELSTQGVDGNPVKIIIKRVGVVEESDYQKVQVMNIIVRKCLASLKLEEIRRNYYDPKAKILVPEYNLELWPGYQTSIGQYEYAILMQAEINFKVLRTDTAYKMFRDYLDKSGPANVRRDYSLAIIGNVVLTKYNNKTYRIDDVDYNENPKSTFKKKSKDGFVNVRYVDYFEKTYGAKIRDLNQPMLVSRSNARAIRSGQPETVYLVPELCVMTGFSDEMRTNHHLMRATAKHTAVGPADRARQIIEFSKRLLNEPKAKETLNDWGLQLNPRLVEVDARVLPPENIYVGNDKTYSAGPDVNWTRNLRENVMLFTASFTKWILIFPARNAQEAYMLSTELQKVSRGMHFAIPQPIIVRLQNDGPSAYVQEIDRYVNQENPQLIACLVTNNRADRYAAIKRKCILDKPVPSQVVLLKSVNNKSFTSIATKIAIQMNCKIGGAAWTVHIPLKGLMIVGFDVCHDPRDKRKSYGAMVATTDDSLARYFSIVKHHAAGDELSVNFGLSLELAVRRYKEINGALPLKIIVYRDGVGEGSLPYVLEQEVGASKTQLSKLYANNPEPLKLAFVIVTKRINTRFFDKGRNPQPGTVVDDVITNPFRYDFYLVSQSVREGTVTPTHYNIIEDSTGMLPEHMQRLTYKLCHMYFNCSVTVRVPAPCQYAHKLAFLTAQSIGADHSNMNNLLYFL